MIRTFAFLHRHGPGHGGRAVEAVQPNRITGSSYCNDCTTTVRGNISSANQEMSASASDGPEIGPLDDESSFLLGYAIRYTPSRKLTGNERLRLAREINKTIGGTARKTPGAGARCYPDAT